MHKYSPITRTICTYLQDFSLLGGIMALAEPSGLMQPYVTLTVHGLTWHLILIFIGLYCHRCDLAGKSWQEYVKTLPLLAVFLAFASIINVATHGQADMFYISPFYPVTQIFFYQVSLLIGTGAGSVFYIFSICLGSHDTFCKSKHICFILSDIPTKCLFLHSYLLSFLFSLFY